MGLATNLICGVNVLGNIQRDCSNLKTTGCVNIIAGLLFILVLIVPILLPDGAYAASVSKTAAGAYSTGGVANPAGGTTNNSSCADFDSGGDWLNLTTFGFAIPDYSTIQGIQVQVYFRSYAGPSVRLIKGGSLVGDSRGLSSSTSGQSYCSSARSQNKSSGGATDLWGTTWTPADINSSDFGVRVSRGSLNMLVSHVQVTVYYEPPALTINDVSLTEGDSGTQTMTFDVTMNTAWSGPFTVDYILAASTVNPASSADVANTSGTLNFAGTAGETQQINATVYGDTLVEYDEQFLMVISNSTGPDISDSQGIGTINNNDTSIISIAANARAEASGLIPLQVSFSNAVSEDVTLTVDTTDSTASASDSDYTAISNTPLVVSATDTSATVNVSITDDSKVEGNEDLVVVLSNIQAGGLEGNLSFGIQANIAKILNDDYTTVTMTPKNMDQNEGTGTGTTPFTVDVTSTNAVQGGFQFHYINYSTNSNEPGFPDFDSTGGNITFSGTAGEVQTITINVHKDTDVEIDDTFNVQIDLSTPGGGISNVEDAAMYSYFNRPNSPVIGTIRNDDTATVTITPPNPMPSEGTGGTTTDYVFDVVLNNRVQGGFVMYYETSDGLAGAPGDYTAVVGIGNRIDFISNAVAPQSRPITIKANHDNIVEPDETFQVTMFLETRSFIQGISPSSISVFGSPATAFIKNDDTATITLSAVSADKPEGTGGQVTPFNITATLDNPVQDGFSLKLTTSDGTAKTSDADYVPINTQLAFTGNANEAKALQAHALHDYKIEPDETFNIAIGPVTPANPFTSESDITISGSPMTAHVRNDDFGDFGDAPAQYPTTLAQNGARHLLPAAGLPLIFLGANVDVDADGQPSTDALGDDTDTAPDDEDGVVFKNLLAQNATVNVDVTASAAGLLDAWIDFDQNRAWNAGEQIFNSTSLAAGVNSIAFTVPATALPGGTYARFRFSTSGGLQPTGLASDGEVEDYLVTILENEMARKSYLLKPESWLVRSYTEAGALYLEVVHSMTKDPIPAVMIQGLAQNPHQVVPEIGAPGISLSMDLPGKTAYVNYNSKTGPTVAAIPNLRQETCSTPVTFYPDSDLDGFGNPNAGLPACSQPPGYVLDSSDCDDTSDQVYPGAAEICDNLDNDCNGATPDGAVETWFNDPTSCGTGVCANTGAWECQNGVKTDTCVQGPQTGPDTDCNGKDENCSGANDENYTAPATSCGVGVCEAQGSRLCVNGGTQDTCTPGSPTETPAETTCNDNLDNDCDGLIDNNDPDCTTPFEDGEMGRKSYTINPEGWLVRAYTEQTAVPGVFDVYIEVSSQAGGTVVDPAQIAGLTTNPKQIAANSTSDDISLAFDKDSKTAYLYYTTAGGPQVVEITGLSR